MNEHDQATMAPNESEQHDVLPLAVVKGEAITALPEDLYIPPDALEVFLEAFEGPLDLLLYLIKKQNFDILDIPVADITVQYVEYVELMKTFQLELAAEYLVMAAMLAEIKSRMLLPRNESEEDEDDPRAELVRRLQEYEQFKQAAENIDALPRMERDIHPVKVKMADIEIERPEPEVELKEILFALKEVFHRADMFSAHHIQKETLSVREKMTKILSLVSPQRFIDFEHLFDYEEGRMGIVVTFLSVMELTKESLIELVQNKPFGPIHVRGVVE